MESTEITPKKVRRRRLRYKKIPSLACPPNNEPTLEPVSVPSEELAVFIKTRIRDRRKRLKLTQHEAAYLAGISQASWSIYENRKLYWKYPPPHVLTAMAMALRTTPGDLGG